MTTLLLVEDDQSLGETLQQRLAKEGYQVSWVQDLACANQALGAGYPDVAIVDIGLPDGDGFSIARTLKLHSSARVLFLTAMSSAEFRLEAYELGADDYIPKPFHLRELLLRLQKLVPRATGEAPLCSRRLRFNSEALLVSILDRDGSVDSSATLPKREFQLLKYLVANTPRVITREEVLAQVWAKDTPTNTRTIDNTIVRIRQLLKAHHLDPCLRSVRGAGYQWVESDVSRNA